MTARDDLGVGTDLAAGIEEDNVVPDKLRLLHLLECAAAHDVEFRGGEDVQLVQLALRAQVLNGADDGVAEDNAHERQIQPLPDRCNAERKQEKEHVEIGEDVFLHNLAGRFARRLDRAVIQPGGDALGDLCVAQASLRCGAEHRNADRYLRPRQGSGLFLFSRQGCKPPFAAL